MGLVGFPCEQVTLDVNEVCIFKKKNQGKVKALLNVVDVGNEM